MNAHTPHRSTGRRDVNERAVWIFAVSLLAVVAVGALFAWQVYRYVDARNARPDDDAASAEELEERLPPAPRLQVDPRRDLEQFQAEEEAVLHTSGWVDREAGIGRIPIDDAMEVMLERGFPTRDAPPETDPEPSYAPEPADDREAPADPSSRLALPRQAGPTGELDLPASVVPGPLREVGFDQHLGGEIPRDLVFIDDRGERVTLARFFGERPVVLSFAYYSCPMLCPQSLSAIARTLKALSFSAGQDFELVTVSIDPRETAVDATRAKEKHAAQVGGPRTGGWHFLTGQADAINRLTRAAGFRYVWDDDLQQFAHPAGIVVLTKDARIARYLFGIDYGARDLRLAVLEASAARISSPVDAVLLYCYQYDPAAGRYGPAVLRIVQAAGAATVIGLVALVGLLLRLERRGAPR